MPLYERLLGCNDAGVQVDGKIYIDGFASIMTEFARGRLTGAQANTAIGLISTNGQPLDAGEQTEASTLVATITGQASAKLARAQEIRDVLMLAELRVPQYDTPSEVKTRLGV